MGSISNIIKKQWGIETTEKAPGELSQEAKKYFEELKQPIKEKPKKVYTMQELKHQFNAVANELTGEFIVNNENKDILTTLFYYFTANDTEFKKEALKTVKNKPSLNKGILLIGNMGSGKTQILDIFKQLKWQSFSRCTVYDVVEAFEKNGEKGLDIFFRGNRFFDELGAERQAAFYGTKEDVLTRILEKRYSSFRDLGLKTHVTTNLSQKQIANRYGQRLEGRILEMFNIIYLGGSTDYTDFRKLKHQ